MDSATLAKFKSSMGFIYGDFEKLTAETAKAWVPAQLSEGHRGRYLWTDGFAVINFLTLFKETQDKKYLICATRLVETVHSVLGYTRDGRSRLSPANNSEPLLGGLRIGKLDEDGEDGDGQYFHYLSIWMFALIQTAYATGDNWFSKQAVSLGKAIHTKFMYKRNSERPRMYWKMSMDLKEPLVLSEGNLDPIDGYVVYSLAQKCTEELKATPGIDLKPEIKDYKKILDSKYSSYNSNDALDLGMTLWTTHWFSGEEEAEEWATTLTNSAQKCLGSLALDRGYFDRSLSRRLAFREFGTVLGIKSHPQTQLTKFLGQQILQSWEEIGACPIPTAGTNVPPRLQPITLVMYATALFPGAFLKDYWKK